MRRHMFRGTLLLLFGLIAFSCGAPAAAGASDVQPQSSAAFTVLRGNAISPFVAKQDRGRVPDSYFVPRLVLHLKRDGIQQSELDKLVVLQRNPKSPYFHKWLSARQFGQLFGPSTSDIQAVSAWLRSQGFHIQSIAPSGMDIVFSGNAGAVRNAFRTELHSYRVGSDLRVAAATDPQIPAALSSKIAGIVSLTGAQIRPLHTRATLPLVRQASTGASVTPQFTVPNGGAPYLLVGPQDFLKIYNVKPVWNNGIKGSGQTIAVVGNSDMLQADWNSFRSSFGLSTYAGTLTQVQPGGCSDPGFNGNEIESAIDTEWSSVAAPDAAIELAACQDSQPNYGDGVVIAAQNLINSATPPQIISFSFGACELAEGSGGTGYIDDLWQQATAEGVAVYVASGDSGSADCDYATQFASQGLQVNAFASSHYSVAVGGTDFSDWYHNTQAQYWPLITRSTSANGYESALSYVSEMTWNNTCASAQLAEYYDSDPDVLHYCNNAGGTGSYFYDTNSGGGGSSIYNSKPSWQTGVHGSPADNSRDLPDVSLFASNGTWGHGLLFCMSDASQGGTPCNYDDDNDTLRSFAGGTSFAAPAFAGIQALINQRLNSRQGNPNYAFYQLGALEYNGVDIGYGSLSTCNSTNGNQVGSDCVFYDVTEGSNDVPCSPGTTQCYSGTYSGPSAVGILSTSANSLVTSYSTGAGWDSATGLGSVNVANLVNSIGTVDSLGGTPYVPGDINADRTADIVLHNPTINQVERWLMNGTTILHSIMEAAPTGGQIQAVGDFNHDGEADFVWGDGSGNLTIWLAQGESGFLKAFLGTAPSGSIVVGSGDIDADGNSDIVFQNSSTGQITIWKMQGSTVTGTVTASLPAGYTISAIGDFDHDGFSDLAVTNSTNDLTIMFAEPGGTFTSFDVGAYPSGSLVIGAGDIDGDTHDDLVFQNPTTGDVTVWLMDGHTIQTAFTTTAPAGYSVANIGDFNGDGRADLLITSSANDLFMWLSQAGNAFSSQQVGSTNAPAYPSGWSVIADQAR